MAGETPTAHGLRKPRRLSHLDDRNTDKTYRGQHVSVLNPGGRNTGSLRPGETLPKPVTVVPRTKVVDRSIARSTDEYYREGGAQPGRESRKVASTAIKKGVASSIPPVRTLPPTSDAPTAAVVTAAEGINAAIDAAIASKQTEVYGYVTVAAGRADLLRRARAALELRVTQEELTEDEARDIRFGYAATAEKAEVSAADIPFAKVPETVRVEDNDGHNLDPEEFLAAGPTEEEVKDVAMTAAVPLANVEVVDEDDFLAPPSAAPAAVEETAAEPAVEDVPAVAEEAPAEEAPVKRAPARGRRSGRGAAQ